jgi:cytochrome b
LKVPVWPLWVRLSHWAVGSVVVFELIRNDGDRLHRIVGYVGAGIVVARVLAAGLARGPDFIAALRPSPRETFAYLRGLARGRAPRHARHDPLGLWMVWLLWTLVLLLAFTGWLSRLDAFWGDERVHDIHAWLAYALVGAAIMHVIAVGVMSWAWRENLPAAMVSGRKRGMHDDGA